MSSCVTMLFFFLNDTPTTEISTTGPPLPFPAALPTGAWFSGPGLTAGLKKPPAPNCRPPAGGRSAPPYRLFPIAVVRPCHAKGSRTTRDRQGDPRNRSRWTEEPVYPAQRHSRPTRSEEHTSELQSLMRTSYAVFCLKKNTNHTRYYIPVQPRNTKRLL